MTRGITKALIGASIAALCTSMSVLPMQVQAAHIPITMFPIKHYAQNTTAWIKPSSDHYDKPLISKAYQAKRAHIMYTHFYGKYSPWAGPHMTHVLNPKLSLYTLERATVRSFTNKQLSARRRQYGENFRAHTSRWINRLKANMQIEALNTTLTFNPDHRAIAITNLAGRALPTNAPSYRSFSQPGQGYPFDNLQVSAIWAGTPLYSVGTTADKSWTLVYTPDFMAWVKSSGIAHVDDAFIAQWRNTATAGMAAITHTKTAIEDTSGTTPFVAYVGSIFPLVSRSSNGVQILIPVRDVNRHATTHMALVPSNRAVRVPWVATPHHMAEIIQTLIGRPYGWGGIYFYNDCSQEMKSLYTPFGIWLPRHSSSAINAGKIMNLSKLTTDQRIRYLIHHGHPLMTVIYINGHIFMYAGNAANQDTPNHGLMAMTYQNLWGLSPADYSSRAIIGESVFLPLLAHYPMDPKLQSLASSRTFIVSNLDQMPH